jgi:hypothetical protein
MILPAARSTRRCKERATATGDLLPGTPGTLYKRTGTGHTYWYRIYYRTPGRQTEDFVGPEEDVDAFNAMSDRIAHSEWMTKQVSNLRKLGYQVADKGVASILVELHSRKLFEAGPAVVGTLAYMAWLNEYGAMAVAARTQDVDLARRQRLRLATPVSFLSSMQATQLPFTAVAGMATNAPSTSVKLRGQDGLRVDVLVPGRVLGRTIPVPELQWHAQSLPHYDYLLAESQKAVLLAGGACIPVALPRIERMIWHKLYSSAHKTRDATKAAKDRTQAATLAALLVEQDGASLRESFSTAPNALKTAALSQRSRLHSLLAGHPETRDAFDAL